MDKKTKKKNYITLAILCLIMTFFFLLQFIKLVFR